MLSEAQALVRKRETNASFLQSNHSLIVAHPFIALRKLGGMVPGSRGMQPPRGPSDDSNTGSRSADRRLKMLEERLTNLRSKLQVTEQNMIQKNKLIFEEIRATSLELTDVKKEIQELKEKVLWLVKEVQDCAKREQVEMLKKYLDYWNPFKFVTKNDVEGTVRDVIEKMRRE